MKKLFLVSLALGITMSVVSTVDAYSANSDDPYSVSNKKAAQIELNDAIRKRWDLSNSKAQRDLEAKNSMFQRMIHRLARKSRHVTERSTDPIRTGKLKTIPSYAKRQHTTKNNYTSRVNYKSIFRKRALDYYVKGGDAGTASLKEGLILGSEHKVPKYGPNWSSGDPKTIKNIRHAQKTLSGKGNRESWIESNKQRSTRSIPNNKYRNFRHPYMEKDLDKVEWKY